jgi:hypothetical protein
LFGGNQSGQQQQQQQQEQQQPAPQQTPAVQAAVPGTVENPEFPPYRVLQKGAAYDLRFYEVYPVVEMDYQRREEGYLALGSYQGGGNSIKSRYGHTQPVVMCYQPDVSGVGPGLPAAVALRTNFSSTHTACGKSGESATGLVDPVHASLATCMHTWTPGAG